MKRKLLFFGIAVAVAAVSIVAGDLQAGVTGKINGVVRDQAGEVLPGANVVIKELNLGSTADADGYFVIINIPPGVYTLSASLIGYETVSQTGVDVTTDHTTTINYNLKETALELGELVVTAGRPLVEPDKTTSKYTVTLEETERNLAAARRTSELLQLQPGVAVDGSNRIRGAYVDAGWYASDVAYVVDGVRMNHNDGRGRGGRYRQVNRGAIQELSVLTGVTPAEYGNAQGGVVQIITKEGGGEINGWGEFRYEPAGKKHWGENVYDSPQHQDKVMWDNPVWANEKYPNLSDKINHPIFEEIAGELIHVRTNYTEWTGFGVEGNLSGPIGDKASFVATAKHERYAAVTPRAERIGFYNDRGSFQDDPGNINVSGSVTFKPTANLKLKVGGMYLGWDWYSNGNPDLFGGRHGTGGGAMVRGSGQNLFLPEKWSAAGLHDLREELQYAVFTHTLSPRTFYEVRLSHSRSKMDTLSGTHETTGEIFRDQAGWFAIGRQAARYGQYDRQRIGAKVDLSSQITKGNFMKAGVEYQTSAITMILRYDTTPAARNLRVIMDEGQMGEKVKPYFLNAYVQDKMEFQGMIVNLGVRLDTFNPNTRQLTFGAYRGSSMFRYYTRARDWAYQEGSLWVTDAPWHVKFSPRIGVSHPITERSQMRFSTGVFLQWADLWYYFGEDYWTSGDSGDRDVNENGRIDATERLNNFRTTYSGQNGLHLLQPAKTTAFEVGADWNFVSDYTATLTAYYKSEVDHFTSYPNETWVGPRDFWIPYSRTLDNGAYGDTRGVEMSIRKSFSHNFSFNVSYNYQWSQITTGKLGNVIRNVYMDSATVVHLSTTNAFTDRGITVPNFWIYWDALPDGSEAPRRLTGDDLVKFAQQGQSFFNGARAKGGQLGTGVWDGLRPVDNPALGNCGPNCSVQINSGSYTTLFFRPKSGDRRNFGSFSLLASFPDDFEFGHSFVGTVLKNLRMNVTSRIQTGGIFNYAPPEGGNRYYRDLALDSRTDLAVEKTFNVTGRVQPTLFADIRNIFNQKDRTSPSNRNLWTYIGLDGPTPDDKNYLNYGDSRDRTYAHSPRLAQFGLRINW